MYTDIIYITLSYKYTLYIEITHTNYLASSLDILIGKTLVFSFGVLFIYLSIDEKLYYNSGLFLNESINLTSTDL